jgi:hypothetical protein
MFKHLKEINIKLIPNKWQFVAKHTMFLGHVVNVEVVVVQAIPRPTTLPM